MDEVQGRVQQQRAGEAANRSESALEHGPGGIAFELAAFADSKGVTRNPALMEGRKDRQSPLSAKTWGIWVVTRE